MRVVDVLEGPALGRTAAAGTRAMFAHADHQDLGPDRPKVVQLLEVVLEVVDQLVLDVEHALADLAKGVLVLLPGKLVVDGAAAEPDGVDGARRRQRLQRAIDRAAGQRRVDRLDVRRDLVGGAMPAEGVDGLPDQLALSRLPETRGEWWPGGRR